MTNLWNIIKEKLTSIVDYIKSSLGLSKQVKVKKKKTRKVK